MRTEPKFPRSTITAAESLNDPIPGQASTEIRSKSFFRDVLETVILIVVVVTISQTVLANYVIQQDSAVPNFFPNQRVFVDKVFYRLSGLNRGDVVVVHPLSDGDDLFKRVIALPGEQIDIHDNQVFINGIAIDEPYIAQGADSQSGIAPGMFPRTLGADEFFLMGDNRTHSADSRKFGPFGKDKLVGRVWLRYWPLNSFSLVHGPSYAAP